MESKRVVVYDLNLYPARLDFTYDCILEPYLYDIFSEKPRRG